MAIRYYYKQRLPIIVFMVSGFPSKQQTRPCTESTLLAGAAVKTKWSGIEDNRVARKMGTYFDMGTDGHRFGCFQIGIS